MGVRRGFTLIELLVVIAIIAILTALLFPVFARAKAQAKLTTSLSNLKQIAAGIGIYANDYDDHAPFASNEGTLWALSEVGYRYGPKYDPRVSPLLISEILPLPRKIFRASFDPGPKDAPWYLAAFKDRWISYHYADWPPLKGLTYTSYEFPAETTLLTEMPSGQRNPRAQANKTGCLRMDLHVQITAPKSMCITQFPEPSLDDLY